MKDINCSVYSLRDVIELLHQGECSFSTGESRAILADWLEELKESRDAIYNSQTALNSIERNVNAKRIDRRKKSRQSNE